MAFNVTKWEFSDEVDQSTIPVEEGQAYLFIRDATFDEDTGIYDIEVENLNTSAQFRIRYFLQNRDENNRVSLDTRAKGTLISLGKALAGVEIGIPFPQDVIGGVVSGYLYPKMSAKGYVNVRCFHYDAVPKDMAEFATIDQYYLGAETQ